MVIRYSKNVAGDFYVEEGCCLTCGVPMSEAPEFFEMDDEQCYVKKQPVTPEDLERTLNAMSSQEAECIHYGGANEEIIRRLVEGGEGYSCDSPLREKYQERLRHIARIHFGSKSASSFLAALIADAKRSKGYDGKPRYRFRSLVTKGATASVKVAWYGHIFHSVSVEMEADGVFLVRLEALLDGAGQGLSRLVHYWARSLTDASRIQWMTDEELKSGGGQPAPY